MGDFLEVVVPVPAPNFGDFSGINLEIPRGHTTVPAPPRPRIVHTIYPRPRPEFRGFSGKNLEIPRGYTTVPAPSPSPNCKPYCPPGIPEIPRSFLRLMQI